MVLTNAQIKALLDTPSSPYPVTLRIFDNIPPKGRQIYPRVDITNEVPEVIAKDYKIKDTSQTFRVILYFRIAGTATAEIATVKTIQDIIRTTLDNAQLAGTKIFREIFNWSQNEDKPDPVRHIETFLLVTANEITSVTGVGLIGAQMTLSIAAQTLQILAETGDEGRNYMRPSDDSGNSKVVPEDNVGSKFLEYEYVKAAFDAVQAAIVAKNEIAATLTEGSTPRAMTVIPVRQRYNVRYDGLKTVILQLEIVSG